jgi:hypothetical protein
MEKDLKNKYSEEQGLWHKKILEISVWNYFSTEKGLNN